MKGITLRAGLYAGVLFFTPFTEKLAPVLSNNQWPSPQSLVLCTLAGSVAALIGIRAYLDGSAERHKSLTGNTDFIKNP